MSHTKRIQCLFSHSYKDFVTLKGNENKEYTRGHGRYSNSVFEKRMLSKKMRRENKYYTKYSHLNDDVSVPYQKKTVFYNIW